MGTDGLYSKSTDGAQPHGVNYMVLNHVYVHVGQPHGAKYRRLHAGLTEARTMVNIALEKLITGQPLSMNTHAKVCVYLCGKYLAVVVAAALAAVVILVPYVHLHNTHTHPPTHPQSHPPNTPPITPPKNTATITHVESCPSLHPHTHGIHHTRPPTHTPLTQPPPPSQTPTKHPCTPPRNTPTTMCHITMPTAQHKRMCCQCDHHPRGAAVGCGCVQSARVGVACGAREGAYQHWYRGVGATRCGVYVRVVVRVVWVYVLYMCVYILNMCIYC